MTLQTKMVENGLGKDVWTVPKESIDSFLLYQWITIILYTPQVTFVKFSMIFLYLRIFPSTVSKHLRLDALSSRNKLVTSIMFLLGLVATVAAGVRIAWIHKFLYTTNFTYENAEFDVLYFVEISICVTCACVPSCARLARKTWRTMRGYEDSHPASVDTLHASRGGHRAGRAGCGGIQISQSFSQKRSTGSHAVSYDAEDEVELINNAFSHRPDRQKMQYSVRVEHSVLHQT
ncbi:hypothetical protein KC318_g3625 [Hortaea werneckii]|nr:hypothetical protein KC334_g2322 [Hortaea werneckii]KAI7024286.1 hypothetical protein KC355_g1466 [Hortaea werneckii]KAI7186518.1 hypothetical protein KC324_g7130 [Hortaea werneckii]KAI7590383.1 hypothetical protein KC316_g3410 [Hortaea werneckii]KAI7671207.1 hypothetical protein KC318_g3625 [Hortaea werneckii]